MPVINVEAFGYVKIQQPDFKYQSKDKEYSVECVVSKETAKAWNKKYPKQKAKEIDREDFAKIYKIDPPYEGDEIYVIKLKKSAQYKDGTPLPEELKPRVFEKTEQGNVDITAIKLVANGSSGVAQFDEVSNDFGTFARLKAIRVDKLIEYRKGGASFDELGEVVGGLQSLADIPEREMSEAQKVQRSEEDSEAKAKPRKEDSPKVETPDDSEFDENLSF